ncbi:substrate-binding domain-containing protein [Chloroflexota bacterium]
MKRKTLSLLGITVIINLLSGFAGCAENVPVNEKPDGEVGASGKSLPAQQRLKIATTTSLYDTGLWGYLEPMFEEKHGVEVDVIYAGTGAAIAFGERGDVDVITVHSRSREEAFIESGYGIKRISFAYNYFLIVGPENDPAGIKGMVPEAALKKLYEVGSDSFVSRGDDSGTHAKEKSIWQAAGYDYESVREAGSWYIETGSGMGPTLLMTNEKQGYTLTDMGTYITYQGDTSLVPLVDEGASLLNVYSVIVGNPETNKNINAEMANNMADFLTSPEIQELIGKYGVEEYGLQLFIPCAGNEPTQ